MSDHRRVTVVLVALRFSIALAAFAVAEVVSERVWPAGGGMPGWVVVLTTGLVVALFAGTDRPCRRLADRLVLGDHAAGYVAGRDLLHRMSSALPMEQVLAALAEITGRTLQADRSEVRLLLPSGQAWSQVWPEMAAPDGAPIVVQVRHDGDPVGEIEANVSTADGNKRERALLRQLASPAGLAMSTVRLTVELQQRATRLARLADDIAESNRRIGTARQTETARINNEIGTRVDPHLDSARELVARAVGTADPAGAGLIGEAREQVGQALDELRNLARRIYPPRLDDGGLPAALEGWQLRTRIGIDLDIRGNQPRLRDDAAVESCLYFLIVAALPDRPTTGPRPSVGVAVDDDGVVVDVVGPEDPNQVDQETMASIRDRVDAFGGELTISTFDGLRTVRARLPLTRPAGNP